jgi:GGDEF domain-containing protein
LQSTSRLAEASQAFDQQLDEARMQISTRSKSDADASTSEDHDSQQPAARAAPTSAEGLVSAVAEFIGDLPSPATKFAVALVSVDQLAKINGKQGRAVSDRIVQAVAQSFTALSPLHTVSTELQRQQILFFQAERSARDATQEVELVRQRIAAAKFMHAGKPLVVTLTCGVAEATGVETPAAIVERLQETLADAVRYGTNRTFFQDGEQTSPAITPTNNKIESRVIEL